MSQHFMATDTRAELVVFDCNLRDGGLEEFEPEDQRGGSWLRVPSPTAADVQQWQPRVELPRARVWPFVLPVVIAAAIAGVAVSWVSTDIPRVDPAVVAPAEPVTSSPAAPPTPAVATAPVVETAPTEPAAPPRASRDPAFEQTLAGISRAYRALDAAAVAAVLPNTDPAELTQAFSELKYQTLSFDHCALRPNGAESAVASCDVSVALAPKNGDAALQRRHEAWTLVLNRSGEAWRIAAVTRR